MNKSKFKLVFIFYLGILSIFISRLYYLQIMKGEEFSEASTKNRIREIRYDAPRGLVYDRNGILLLSNKFFFDLVITPQYLRRKSKVFHLLSHLIDIPEAQIEKKLLESSKLPSFQPHRIKKNLSLQEVAKIQSMKFFLPGVEIHHAMGRDYRISGSSHLLGYVGETTEKEMETLTSEYHLGSPIGKHGIERKFETTLRGKEGKKFFQVDALGRLQSKVKALFSSNIPMESGKNIFITIDSRLQKTAMEAFRGKSGAIVVMNPQNGEILAYISQPTLDLEHYQKGLSQDEWENIMNDPHKPLLDKASAGLYPPASTFKVVTALAALEEGLITPQTTFPCHGSYTLGNGKWKCWKHSGHGVMDLQKAIAESCDVYFYQLGNLLGATRLAKWASLLGLGKKTGIDLNLEYVGIVPTPTWKMEVKKTGWSSGDTINMAIGQGFNLATPLQILNLYSAIGNGGHLYHPFLLKKEISKDGLRIKFGEKQLVQSISLHPGNLEVIQDALRYAVDSGTARGAAIPGKTVSGKTGTAQVVNLSRFTDDYKDHAWFVGYSPARQPQIAVVILSEFDGGGGGKVAPIAKKIIETYWKNKL